MKNEPVETRSTDFTAHHKEGKSESHAEADIEEKAYADALKEADALITKKQWDEETLKAKLAEVMARNTLLEEECKQLDELNRKKKEEAQNQEKEKSDLSQELRRVKSECEALDALSKRLWPECLNIFDLKTYESKWRDELKKKDADPELLSMFANIFAWSCANEICSRKADSADPSIEGAAITAIHNFSRFLFINLQNEGIDPADAEIISDKILQKINGQLTEQGASYKLWQPVLNTKFSSKSMDPSPAGTATGVVDSLCTWAVTNAQGTIYNKKARVLLKHSCS